MNKVGIIGCGAVGATFAHDLYTLDIANIVIVNHNSKKADSNVRDILDCIVDPEHHTIKAGSYEDIRNADIVVNCAGDSSLLRSRDRQDELESSRRIAKDIVDNLNRVMFNGVFINIMNPCDEITYYFKDLCVADKRQIIGTGTLLETLRLRRIVYELTHKRTSAYVVGRHGTQNAIVCPEQDIMIGLNTDYILQRVQSRVWDIYTGKGYTNFGISNALQLLVRSVLFNTDAELCVSTLSSEPVYGFQNMCISVPCKIGSKGINSIPKKNEVQLTLNTIFKGGKQ